MKEFIDKLIERLEEKESQWADTYSLSSGFDEYASGMSDGFEEAIKIANELAEEYNNGWIPYATGCNMPNEASRVWLSFTTPLASFVKSAWYINGHFEWDNCKKVKETPTAWKPYDIPAPYTEGE